MDSAPSCAICNAPAYPECPCESDRLQIAVQQSEKRVLGAKLAEIREWVIEHARAHILHTFSQMTSSRKAAHTARIQSIPYYQVYMQYSGNPPIHPAALAQLQAAISETHAELKRGIDADWRASVVRYPEVLDYFYSLVDWRMPSERASSIVEPPFALLGAPSGSRAIGYGGGEKDRREKRSSKDRRSYTPAPMERRPSNSSRRNSFQLAGRVKGPPVAPTPPAAPSYGRKGGYYGY